MTQLVERVRRIEQIKYEKERHKRFDKSRREKLHIWNHIKIMIIL